MTAKDAGLSDFYPLRALRGATGMVGDLTGLAPSLPDEVVGRAQQALAGSAQAEAGANLKRIGLAGLGVGAAAAGGVGLYNLLRRQLAKPKPDPRLVALPYPVAKEDENTKAAGPGDWFWEKYQSGAVGRFLNSAGSSLGNAGSSMAGALGLGGSAPAPTPPAPMPAPGPARLKPPTAVPSLPSSQLSGGDMTTPKTAKLAGLFGVDGFLGGSQASTPGEIPLYRAAAPLAAVGGLGGGYLLTQLLLDARRKRERRQELDQSRGQFQDELLAQSGTKRAALVDYEAKKPVLESVFAVLLGHGEKHASVGGFMGARTGDYLAYGGLATALSALAGYQLARKRSPQRSLDAALKERARARLAGRPDPLYAVPTPVVPNEDEERTPLAIAA